MINIMRWLYELFNVDQIRIIFVSMFSSLLAYLTPTKGFLIALVVMFGFNIWCGMRADGVSIIRCKNFKWDKFKNALVELLLYLIIIEVVFSFMSLIGDGEIIAYPRNKGFRIIYHVIRFEFKRATPTHVQGIIDRIENELDKEERYENID